MMAHLFFMMIGVVVVIVVVHNGFVFLPLVVLFDFILLLLLNIFPVIENLLHLLFTSVVIHAHKARSLQQKNFRKN